MALPEVVSLTGKPLPGDGAGDGQQFVWFWSAFDCAGFESVGPIADEVSGDGRVENLQDAFARCSGCDSASDAKGVERL